MSPVGCDLDLELGQLYVRYAPLLRRYLQRRSGEAALSEELTQVCFLRLLSRLRSARPKNIPAYLRQIATHLLIDHQRSDPICRAEALSDYAWQNLPGSEPGPEQLAELQQRLDRLQRGLGELPALTRRIFILCRLEERSYRETASQLGISLSTVQKHLTFARRFFRQRLRD